MKHVRYLSISLVALAVVAVQARADCTCYAAKADSGWCSDCKVGYFAGAKLKSRNLLRALEGRTVDLGGIKCPSCKTAHQTGGWCAHCHAGFAGNKVYRSWVAHGLAKGEAKEEAQITCTSCRKNTEKPGWCDSCKVGMVGTAAFKDKNEFERAAEAHKALLAAADSKCEKCAIAIVTDGKCDVCNVGYKNGKKLAKGKP